MCLSHQCVHTLYKSVTAGNVSSGVLPYIGLEKIRDHPRENCRMEKRLEGGEEGGRGGGRQRGREADREGGTEKVGGWENGRLEDGGPCVNQ